MVDLLLCEVKFSDPNESAEARALVVEEEVEGRSGTVGDRGTWTEPTLWEAPWRAGCRRNCRALARAFSCVRTNEARCYNGKGG